VFVLEDLSDPKRRRWLRRANIPSIYLGRTIGDLLPYANDKVVRSDIHEWITSVRAGAVIKGYPQGLAFYGKPGHGKTALALAIVQELLANSRSSELGAMWCPADPGALSAVFRPVWYGYYPEILALAKKAMNGDAEATALEDALFGRSTNTDEHVRVLVLDDLGKEHRTNSKWAENYFDHLLRTRFYGGYTTLLTSNVDRDEWATYYGNVMDSFCDEAFYAIAIASKNGKDRRRQ
jgi:DNA replication protein DnaC